MSRRIHSDETEMFVDCRICGIRLGLFTTAKYCTLCKFSMQNGDPKKWGYVRPDFQISIYTRSASGAGMAKTLHALKENKITYWHTNMWEDHTAMLYMLDLCGFLPHTFVTISRPGKTIDYWADSDDVDKIGAWITQALRDEQELAA